MARFLVQGEWYDDLAPNAMYETSYEDMIRAKAGHLFPQWHFVTFKCKVSAPGTGHGTRIPDFALVHRSYRSWYVAEIELSHHSLKDHVEPQIEVFSLGVYGRAHADYLVQHSTQALDAPRLDALVHSTQPRVLVVVNAPVPNWTPTLRHHFTRLLVVQPMQTRLGRVGYLVSGSMPDEATALVSHCRKAPGMPKCLFLENPASLDCQHGGILRIESEAAMSDWYYFLMGDSAFLAARGRYPFSNTQIHFSLTRKPNGQLCLSSRSSPRRRRPQ